MSTFVKRRDAARPGSIPERLQMFPREVRFYTEVAPEVGVRVPLAFRATESAGATYLELEDLSDWREGADPVAAARLLAGLHERWLGRAEQTWPWLPRVDASDLVGALYDDTWTTTRTRDDVPAAVRRFGDSLVGEVGAIERDADRAGAHTLTHGDPSDRNLRTGPLGELVLLDWEDVGTGPGICDVAWFLASSVHPVRWDEVLDAYGTSAGLSAALPAIGVQAILSMSDDAPGSPQAHAWVERLEEVVART